ncbi:MAG: penicillin acylase family protein [Halioglobus sp.]|nr:penicillin acylase family protein [Halioglobus sp.]
MYTLTNPPRHPNVLVLALSILLSACGDGGDGALETYRADIVWTQYGIPHINADDYGSVGYGVGYAYARENFCTIMREYVFAAGESALYLGEEGDFTSDLVMKLFNSDARIDRMIAEDLPGYVVENLTGYAAGINRYLRETGVDNLAQGEEGCRGEAWVREIDLRDTVRLIHRTVLRASAMASSGPVSFPNFMVDAQPGQMMARMEIPQGMTAEEFVAASLAAIELPGEPGMPATEQMGSNAYAIGADASQTSSGLLFGNPHFPWQGQERFFMFHVTLGDGEEYDMMGAALGGLPAPVIGFNRNVAWSHTVSTGNPRTVFYELTLNPDNPLQYMYDGEMRDITSETVTAQRIGAQGEIETVEHTFYFSHIGVMLELGSANDAVAGWPTFLGTAFTYFDANLENLRGLDQWLNMGRAANLQEFKDALRPIGIPWVNTIAADRYGDAFYGDISVHPHASDQLAASCVRSPLQQGVTGFGLLTLDGSDSACELGRDGGTVAGIFGYDNLPKLETREYGANANDSYWLPNPRNLLTGFPGIIGPEEVQQSVRTRHTFSQAERRLAGTDGLGEPGFNIDNLRTLSYQATNHAAELVLDDLLTVCENIPEDPLAGMSMVQMACDVLAGWDGSHRVDSVGGHIFYEFWRNLDTGPDVWATPFDPGDPVNTPRDLDIDDPDVAAAVLEALAGAVDELAAAGIELDAPWGEVQFDERNGVRIPIHGGSGSMMFSVISSGLVDGEGYSNIRHGNSYMQAVTWDESDCPVAFNIITYSQSTDPASPHYADMTELYGNSGWVDAAYCQADIEAAEIGRMTISE